MAIRHSGGAASSLRCDRPLRASPGCRFDSRGGEATVAAALAPSQLSEPVGNVYTRAVSGRDSLLQTDDGTTSFFQPIGAPARACLYT